MYSYALAFPVAPGKTRKEVEWLAEWFKSNPEEYRKGRDAAGITFERAYYQETPMGDFVVAYVETTRPFGEVMGHIAQQTTELDRHFVKHVQNVHGVDLTQPPAGPAPETVAAWHDGNVTTRKHGLAFCAPLIPKSFDTGKKWAHEAFETRRSELEETRRSWGQSHEVVTVNFTPHGEIACVYLEGDNPVEGNKKFASATDSYNTWFKEQLKNIFPPQIDFNAPVPQTHEIFDSEALPVAR